MTLNIDNETVDFTMFVKCILYAQGAICQIPPAGVSGRCLAWRHNSNMLNLGVAVCQIDPCLRCLLSRLICAKNKNTEVWLKYYIHAVVKCILMPPSDVQHTIKRQIHRKAVNGDGGEADHVCTCVRSLSGVS